MLIAIGAGLGALALTSGWFKSRAEIELYLRVASAVGLNQDTRVVVQGLEVGRVKRIDPVLDTATGSLQFLARISVRERFPDGSEFPVPTGTRAVITTPTAFPLTPVVELRMPDTLPRTFLQEGDTLDAVRFPSALDAVGEVATRLSETTQAALEDARALMARTGTAMTGATALLDSTAPRVQDVLNRLATTLAQANDVMVTAQPAITTVVDSLVATLSHTRVLLAQFDSLASTATVMATENRETINETLQHLLRSSIVLEHFAEQLSSRPLRLLTGVTPPPDSGQ